LFEQWTDLLLFGGLALAGAVAHALQELYKGKAQTFPKVLAGGFVGLFSGLLVHYFALAAGIERNLALALAAATGWVGTTLLDHLAALVQKLTGVAPDQETAKSKAPTKTAAEPAAPETHAPSQDKAAR